MTEKELVRRARKDVGAFEELYQMYYPKINNFVYHRVQDEATRNEIVSNIFFKMMKNLPKFRFLNQRKSSFSSWLYRIAISEINQYFRDQQRERKIREMLVEHMNEDGNDMFDINFETVQKAIHFLSSYEQSLISLKFFEKLKYKDVAEILKQKEGTVKVQMHRTLEKLRNILQGDMSYEEF